MNGHKIYVILNCATACHQATIYTFRNVLNYSQLIQSCLMTFIHSHPKSGSFVRPTKVDGGVNAVQALVERYGLKNDDEAGVRKDELFVLDQYLNQTVVEMVGAKKVNLQQRSAFVCFLIYQVLFCLIIVVLKKKTTGLSV